ncbi:MAG: acyl-CoA dehydrogenase family protein [Flavobacteriales bacterium]|jgi:alkylation response protein AidB-like acyl-CoA dehydrogenase|nr:acyl-CoA dehydrogenase family protein [Flavobacteriales bacterium]
MDFSYNENQQMIADMIRKFGKNEITPNVREWDDNQTFPVEVFKKLGDLGLMGVLVPTEYGGSGFSYTEYVTAIEELSILDPSIGLSMAAHNSLCTGHILQFGSEDQKKKWLPKLVTAEWIGAWGLTEHNTGSDAGAMSTTAKKDGEYWVLNGSKNFITHAISGNIAVVIARTGKKGDSHGMTAFVIEKGTEGFTSGKKEDKLGMRASETAELIFDNCRVHESNILGDVGDGFVQSMKVLDGGRISIASLGLGIAKGAYETAKKYSQEREQFGKPISHFQAIAFKIADMATKIEAAELLIYKAAYLKNNGKKVTTEGAMAKYFSSEIAVEISTDAVQVLGGYGYTKDFPAERYYRDSKLCTIGEGTSEIQKIVISKQIIK